ncbi:MAG: transcription termination factor Rho [Lachnospiraceae bacterium]|nr:transcription termination factor Rho [Lachnospiraceae bacterium]
MTKEKYETLSLQVLRDLAKARGMKGFTALKKADLIERMMTEDTNNAAASSVPTAPMSFENGASEARLTSSESQRPRRGRRPMSSEPSENGASEERAVVSETARPRRGRRSMPSETNENGASEDRTTVSETPRPRRGRRPIQADNSEAGENGMTTTAPRRGRRPVQADNTEAGENGMTTTAPRRGRRPYQKNNNENGEQAATGRTPRRGRVVNSAVVEGDAVPQSVAVNPANEGDARMTNDYQPVDKSMMAIERPSSSDRINAIYEENGGSDVAADAKTAYASSMAQPPESENSQPADRPMTQTSDRPMNQSADRAMRQPADSALESAGERQETPQDRFRDNPRASGILEVMPDGYGFMRAYNYMPGDDDIYVSPSQIRRFGLKTGDKIMGQTRAKGIGEKIGALLFVEAVNDLPPEEARKRTAFENMTPTFPDHRIRLERPDGSVATRIVDLISPIGRGQRGMIVSPPKAGKTTLLKDIARSILRRDPEAHLMILLIDERPEEVTDMKESVYGPNVEIIFSTFDELPEHHKRVSEMAIERAKRLVEHHQNVFILLDSITRLARAYNVLVPPSGRTLSGGLDPTALYMPKRFFGAARNLREGGSLTILATALVDTGSKMDDVVYEEFKGTGNMELILDRRLQERRIFPAIDIVKSGTRREDLLLTQSEQEAVNRMRRSMNGMKSEEAVEAILRTFARTGSNDQVVNAVLSGRLAP